MPFSRSTKNGLFIVWTENPISRPPLAPPPAEGFVELPAPASPPLSQPIRAADAASTATAQSQRVGFILFSSCIARAVCSAGRSAFGVRSSGRFVCLDRHLVHRDVPGAFYFKGQLATGEVVGAGAVRERAVDEGLDDRALDEHLDF